MSETLFLFIKNNTPCLDDTLSIVIGSKGTILAIAKNRTPAELTALQKKYPLTIILPSTLVNAHYVRLPTLKKAALMIPNMLEESLLENIDNMHFVFDKEKNTNQQHLVYSINKSWLNNIISELNKASLSPTSISCDLLPSVTETLLISDNYVQLINKESLGALSLSSLKAIDPKYYKTLKTLLFKNSNQALFQTIQTNQLESYEETYQEFIAKKHMKMPGLNLLQDEFKIKNKKSTLNYFWSIGLTIISLIFFITTQVMHYQSVQTDLSNYKKENFQIYKKIFPLADRMISPRYRVEQWLKENTLMTEQPFFQLMHKISPQLHQQKSLNLQSINYQNQNITIGFKLKSFEELNQLQQKLEVLKINVNQLSALTEHNEINAIWRLSL